MEYQAFSDGELLGPVRENAPGAFTELSARYAEAVRFQAGQFRGPSAPEQEDLCQEGFLGLYLAALSFSSEGGASFRTYANVCIRNRMLTAFRNHQSVRNRPLNESLSLNGDDAPALEAQGGPEDRMEAKDRFQRLLQQIDRVLTPLERRALSLYLSGCGREEAARRMGTDVRAFDNAMYRVRTKLKTL